MVLRTLAGLHTGRPLSGGNSPWLGLLEWVARSFGIPFNDLSAFASNPLVHDGVKLLMFGSVIETGRRLFKWIWSLMTFRMFSSI